jgi:hypothetical protein
MPNVRPKVNQGPKSGHKKEAETVNLIDQLEQFDEFKSSLYPLLQKAVREGWDAKKVQDTFAPLLQIKAIMHAASEMDTGKAMGAIKDVLDRAYGKPKETVEQKHTFANAKDEEIDAILLSKLSDAGLAKEDDDTH